MSFESKISKIKFEIIGADEKLIKADHYEIYIDLFLNGRLPSESILIPLFIFNLQSQYTSICHRYYGEKNFHNLNDLDIFNDTLKKLSKDLTGKNCFWFSQKKYKNQIQNLATNLKLNDAQEHAIEKIIFNYFVSTIYEDFFRELKLPRTIISIIDERQELAIEINNHINEIINRIAENVDYSPNSYRIADNLLKKSRKEIKVELLGKNFEGTPPESTNFESMNRFFIKKILFPLSFRPSKKENISYNQLIFSLYLQFKSQNEINYMSKMGKVLDFIRDLPPLKQKLPNPKKGALQKKIKVLIKKNRNLKDSHIRNLEKIEQYLDDEFPEGSILNDLF